MTEGKPSLELTKKDGLMVMLYALPIMLLFACLGDWKRGLGAWICTGLLFLVVRSRWDLKNHSWFWVILAIMGALQVPFIVYVPWSDTNLSYASLLPVGLLDFAIMYGGIKLAEKLTGKRKSSSRR